MKCQTILNQNNMTRVVYQKKAIAKGTSNWITRFLFIGIYYMKTSFYDKENSNFIKCL